MIRTDNTTQTTNKIIQPINTLVLLTKCLTDRHQYAVPVNAYMFLTDTRLKLSERLSLLRSTINYKGLFITLLNYSRDVKRVLLRSHLWFP